MEIYPSPEVWHTHHYDLKISLVKIWRIYQPYYHLHIDPVDKRKSGTLISFVRKIYIIPVEKEKKWKYIFRKRFGTSMWSKHIPSPGMKNQHYYHPLIDVVEKIKSGRNGLYTTFLPPTGNVAVVGLFRRFNTYRLWRYSFIFNQSQIFLMVYVSWSIQQLL